MVLMVQISIKLIIDLDIGLAPIRRQAIIWANDGLVYWRIYTPLSRDEIVLKTWHHNITDL